MVIRGKVYYFTLGDLSWAFLKLETEWEHLGILLLAAVHSLREAGGCTCNSSAKLASTWRQKQVKISWHGIFGSSSCRSYVVQTPPVPLKSVERSGRWGYNRFDHKCGKTPQLVDSFHQQTLAETIFSMPFSTCFLWFSDKLRIILFLTRSCNAAAQQLGSLSPNPWPLATWLRRALWPGRRAAWAARRRLPPVLGSSDGNDGNHGATGRGYWCQSCPFQGNVFLCRMEPEYPFQGDDEEMYFKEMYSQDGSE